MFIGGDGYFKLGYFGSCWCSQNELLTHEQVTQFDKEVSFYCSEKLKPPEFRDLSRGAVITSKADIWQLGILIQSLFKLEDGYNTTSYKYSECLVNLKQSMLKSSPRERPCAIDILHIIASKEALTPSSLLIGNTEVNDYSTSGIEKTQGILSSFTEKFMKYINKTGTKGWVISATEGTNTEPKHKYIQKLINKAWMKPEKIIKFYRAVLDRIKTENTVITLKTCIALQQYIFNGPIEAIHPSQNPKLPLELLITIRSTWQCIMTHNKVNNNDCCRSFLLTTLIQSYSEFLINKVKFLTTYGEIIDSSYASSVQQSEGKLSFQFEIFKALVELWQASTKMHEVLLKDPKELRNVKIATSLAVVKEEHGIMSILAHMIKVCKSLKQEEYTDGQYFVNTMIEEFSRCYGKSIKLCNSLQLVAELSERKNMIPAFPLGLDSYLCSYNPTIKLTLKELGERLNMNEDIMGVRIPQRGKPISLIDESLSKEELVKDNEEVKAITHIIAPVKKDITSKVDSPRPFLTNQHEDDFKYFEYLMPSNSHTEDYLIPDKVIPKEDVDAKVEVKGEQNKTPNKVKVSIIIKENIEIADLLGIDSPIKVPKEHGKEELILEAPLIPVISPLASNNSFTIAQSEINLTEEFVKKEQVKEQNILEKILEQEVEFAAESFFINMKEVTFEKLVGTGASAEVFKGVYRSTDVAIKKLRQENIDKNTDLLKEFKREVTALLKLRHSNLVLFIGVGKLPEGNMCILTEYCRGGTLFKLLHESTHIQLSWKQRCKIAFDIAKGMNFLHSCKPPFIHRDLKSLNLLLSEPITSSTDYINVKITDFGLTRNQPQDQYMTANTGTSHWMAPEICMDPSYTIKADVYSYGIVLWEIITRDLPYKNIPVQIIPYRVIYYNERPDLKTLPSDCPLLVFLFLKDIAEEPNDKLLGSETRSTSFL